MVSLDDIPGNAPLKAIRPPCGGKAPPEPVVLRPPAPASGKPPWSSAKAFNWPISSMTPAASVSLLLVDRRWKPS